MGGGDSDEVPSSPPNDPPARIEAFHACAASSPPRRETFTRGIPDVRCLKPYIGSGRMAFPCGQCQSCRINKRRIWTHRIMLEAMQHAENSFVTLTYGTWPEGGSLSGEHLTKWLKRLRKRVGRIRYFAVGEYGDVSRRPHYHAAVFGLGCRGGPSVRLANGGRECRCITCSAVRETWSYGHTMCGTLEERSAQYIAGYVVKKMTRPEDPRLEGRMPEFARMSLKPGIGAGAVPDVASVLMQFNLEKNRDVPNSLRHGGRLLPLGRYLMKRLRKEVGLDEKAPPHVLEALRQGLLPVYEAAFAVAPGQARAPYRKELIRQAIELENTQPAANQAAKFMMKRRSL